MMEKEQALEHINSMSKRLCALSDAIWDHPETGYKETFATQSYCDFLLSEGFHVERGLAGIDTAFCGTFGSGTPVIGILAEFDALPGMSQEAGLTQQKAVRPGDAGHGCGHNLLGVGSLAAALAIQQYIGKTGKGTVRFFGCPAEEGGAGKSFMARDGVFDGLDLALSWHPDDYISVQRNSTTANYQICYHFYGKASHASISPELGRSALDAVELMNIGVQFLREHVRTDTRIHYAITNSGGTSPNIVQPYGEVLYLMRAPELHQVKEVYERVNDIAKGAALMTGTRVEIEFIKACSNILPNTTLANVLQSNMDTLGSITYSEQELSDAQAVRETFEQADSPFDELIRLVPDHAIRKVLQADIDSPLHGVIIPDISEEQISVASTDVGDVSWVCPCAQISVTTMPAGTAIHSWQEVSVGKSSFAHKGMLYAGKVLAGAAIDVLNSPEIVQQAKEEHHSRTQGHSYQSPIPKEVRPRIW